MSRGPYVTLPTYAEAENESGSDYPRFPPARPSPRRGREAQGRRISPPDPHEGLHSDRVRSAPEGIGAEGHYAQLAESEVVL